MDVKKMSKDMSGIWTNEKHLNYLNRMEASFVKTMFENSDDFPRSMLSYSGGSSSSTSSGATSAAPPALNRYVADSAESTRDIKYRRNIKQETDDTRSTANDGKKNERKSRRRSSRPYDAFNQDQVVPQMRKSDKVDSSRNL
ncbi:hypothetical protein ACHQM5_000772 [Ranunculus cassubicifolius]